MNNFDAKQLYHGAGPHGQYAGFVTRLLAFVLDVSIISLLQFIFSFIVVTVWQFFAPTDFIGAQLQPFLFAVSTAFGIALTAGYFALFWVVAGQTPGDALFGLRIVRLDGSKLKTSHAFIRYIGFWLSALPLFLGFLWVLIDDRRQGWHDKLAGTCVTYNRNSRRLAQSATVRRLNNQ